jgi:hypothetical protein
MAYARKKDQCETLWVALCRAGPRATRPNHHNPIPFSLRANPPSDCAPLFLRVQGVQHVAQDLISRNCARGCAAGNFSPAQRWTPHPCHVGADATQSGLALSMRPKIGRRHILYSSLSRSLFANNVTLITWSILISQVHFNATRDNDNEVGCQRHLYRRRNSFQQSS